MEAISMNSIKNKLAQGIRLNESDALWLYEKAPLGALGRLANQVNLQKNGLAVFYNVNRHINPTNICALSCKFCAYSKKIGEEGGYAYEIDEMIAKAGEAIAQGATELHMVGGLHPRWGFQRYVDMIAAMRKAYPEVHLKAFTAVELDWMARKARITIKEVIETLRNAGLNSFPGGGAEIFHPEVRDAICDTKVSAEQWIETHRTAHELGMRSNCTMLYGHIETYAHRVDHMRYLRDLQDKTRGFNVFIPLAFQPFQNEMGVNRYTFGADDLRTIAVARLYLDNFKHIKSYWVMTGQDVAQLALHFGANDLDGTVLEEKISRAAGGRSGMIMTRSNLEDLIRRSGRIPVERTTLYEPIHEKDREHLHPVISEDSDGASDLLLQVRQDHLLTSQQTWQIATTASLMQLAEAASEKRGPCGDMNPVVLREVIDINGAEALCASDKTSYIRTRIDTCSATSIAASHTSVDLRLILSHVNPQQIDDLISVTRRAAPQSRLCLKGLSSLKDAASHAGRLLTEWFAQLRYHGVISLEDSQEDHTTLSLRERIEILSAAAAADLRTSVILTLSAKQDRPDWSTFSEHLVQLRAELSSVSMTNVMEVHLQKNMHADFLMPSEFMKGVALARITLGSNALIFTDPSHIPSLAPQQGLGADASHHPVMKLLSLVSTFGANGLGAVSLGNLNIYRILEDLKASGEFAQLVDYSNQSVDIRSDKAEQLRKLRHIPSLTA